MPGLEFGHGLGGTAAIVHRFDSQLGCPADEIKRVAGFVDEINKLPHIISIRKD